MILPAMDDDDLRRVNLPNHKGFDEANRHSGRGCPFDGCLRFGLYKPIQISTFLLSALKELSFAAGSSGMVGDRNWICCSRAKKLSLDDIKVMQSMKTGALIRASCVCGALLAGAKSEIIDSLSSYGSALGGGFPDCR